MMMMMMMVNDDDDDDGEKKTVVKNFTLKGRIFRQLALEAATGTL